MKISFREIRHRCLKADEAEKPCYARHITHFFSTALIWLLQNAPFTPNQISCAALIIAFLAIPFYAAMTPVSVLAGMLLIEGYYVLDAMDGQWARFKNMKSLTGAFLDYLSNYAIQPPLLFAIGWGLYQKTENALFCVLGFLAGFSSLWVILIWNLRAAILLDHLIFLNKAPAKAKYGRAVQAAPRHSIFKKFFGSIHKTFVFPWLMNMLTVVSLFAFIAGIFFLDMLPIKKLFSGFLYYYGIGGPLMAIILTTYWITTQKLDNAPEIENPRSTPN